MSAAEPRTRPRTPLRAGESYLTDFGPLRAPIEPGTPTAREQGNQTEVPYYTDGIIPSRIATMTASGRLDAPSFTLRFSMRAMPAQHARGGVPDWVPPLRPPSPTLLARRLNRRRRRRQLLTAGHCDKTNDANRLVTYPIPRVSSCQPPENTLTSGPPGYPGC